MEIQRCVRMNDSSCFPRRRASRTRLADEMATPAGGTKAVEAAADAGKATADTIGASSALADGTITVAADGAEGAAKKHKKKHKHKHSLSLIHI